MIQSTQSAELKTKKGESIFLIPQGNAVVRNVSLTQQIITDKLIKCGDIKATCETIGSFYVDGAYDNYNSGYLPFLTMEDAVDYIEAKSFLSEIKYMDLSNLSIEDVKAIKNIILNGN